MVANEKGETTMQKLKLVLPKGHLENGSLEIFERAGLKIKTQPRRHEATSEGGLFEKILFTRSKQVPVLLDRKIGGYDLGIVGQDILAENGSSAQEVMKLNFNYATSGSVKVVLFASAGDSVKSASEVPQGSEILTEYPNITKRFFENLGIDVNLVYSPGSTESDVPDGYRFGICIVETGNSITANGLKIVETLFESSTVLVASQEAMADPEKAKTIYLVKKLLASVLDAEDQVLIFCNVDKYKKDAVLEVLPSLKMPSVSSLVDGRSFSISTVISRKELNSVMIKALQAGAEDWIELPITRLVRKW